MQTFVYEITDPAGLHARPATSIAAEASGWPCEIIVALDRTRDRVSACDLMGLMGLDARQGDRLQVSADGSRASEALASLLPVFDF